MLKKSTPFIYRLEFRSTDVSKVISYLGIPTTVYVFKKQAVPLFKPNFNTSNAFE